MRYKKHKRKRKLNVIECYCGHKVDETEEYCPRCDCDLDDLWDDYYDNLPINRLYIADVAHDGESLEEAKYKVEKAVEIAKFYNYKGVKIIHGYGSKRGHSHIIHDNIVPFLRQLSNRYNIKLTADKQTKGAHIIFLKRYL